MAKKYRVRRYYGKDIGLYRAKPRPIGIILAVVALVGLGYLGTLIYEPVYDLIMNIGKSPVIAQSEPESSVSAPEESSAPSEAEPESEPEPERTELRTIYVPHEIAADAARLDEFLQSLSGTNINAVMIDVKNAAGEVLFKSTNEKANEWDAVAANALDLKSFSATLEQKGFGLVVKMSVFRDPIAAAKGKRDYAIGYRGSDTYLWLDDADANGGKPWLNPYSVPARDYLSSIAIEAVSAGAKMIVLENFRFPDNSSANADFGDSEDVAAMGRADILKSFIKELTESVARKGALTATYYTTLEPTALSKEEDRYGGPVLKLPEEILLLDVRPALFGGDYAEAGLEIVNPLEDPAGTVTASLNYVKQGVGSATTIIPLLQGGNVGRFNEVTSYTAAQVKAQIEAAEALGFDEYFLYSADGIYFLK